MKDKVIPMRLKRLREEKNLTQTEFIAQIAEIMENSKEGKCKVSGPTVSNWECGYKTPSSKYISSICKLYGCTPEYLYGYTDDPLSSERTNSNNDPLKKEKISFDELAEYDRIPVYVNFNNYEEESGWGIYDRKKNRIIFADFVLNLNSNSTRNIDISLYRMNPSFGDDPIRSNLKKLDLVGLLSRKDVYIYMNSPSDAVRSMYNGWYHHNEDKSALINASGLVLPYDGLNKAFFAYPDRKM